MTSLNERECFDLFTLLDYRMSNGSIIISSQLEISEWHKQLGGNILADGVLDRLSSSAYKIILSGDSLRKE
ncbi:MAG: ATP-binding protein [Fusobacterium sp.]|uniref:ATP-binding protein n=1 Tax=Fusobacterium sp. TaxID=68766 RepID=UPI0025CD23E8|nr:ATP-binding protein [uncultured Fusobacterium sp.]